MFEGAQVGISILWIPFLHYIPPLRIKSGQNFLTLANVFILSVLVIGMNCKEAVQCIKHYNLTLSMTSSIRKVS